MAESIQIITAGDLMAYPGAGSPSEEDAAVWVMLINGLITEEWKTPEDPVPFWVKTIALATAAPCASNPKGLQSWTRTLDDGSRTERLPEAAARAGLRLADADRRRLRGLGPRRRSRFGTIRVGIGY
jgi:hypothetical protein